MIEEKSKDLKTRTRAFALRIIRLYGALPKTTEAQVIGRQMLDSGTSVGAHYREAMRARSPAEFISKIEGGLQELEETIYWLELLVDADIIPVNRLADLFQEADELTAMLVSSAKTTKERNSQPSSKRSNRAIREESTMYSAFITPYSSLITPSSLSPAAKRSGSFIVTVFGGARVPADTQLYQDSLLLGRLLAEDGHVVATGGYTGTMEAVLRGAAEAGAHTIGFTCSTFEADSEPNGWIKEERKTATLTARIQRMADESDAFVVVHGGLGTLAELALVWNMILAHEIRLRPLVVVGPEWSQMVESIRAHTQMGSSAAKLLTLVDSPEAAVAVLASDRRPNRARDRQIKLW